VAFDVITCSRCKFRHKVPAEDLGKTFLCVNCGGRMPTEDLPIPREAPPESAAPAGEGVAAPKPMSDTKRLRLGELLVKEGFITQAQLDEGLKIQAEHGGKLAEVLMSLGFLDPDTFTRFQSKQPGVASIDLSNYAVPEGIPELVPRQLAFLHELMPIDKLGKHLTVAMACPLNVNAIVVIERLTGLKVRALLCSPEGIRLAHDRYYPPQ